MDSIEGFVWTLRLALDDQWKIMFDKLKDYKRKHGDCLVPAVYEADKKLGYWVQTQRKNNKSKKLLAERKTKLDSIGFVWNVPALHDQWKIMFEKLKDYKREHGDCLVPVNYDKDKSLGRWVKRQRQNKRNGTLLAERRAKLDSIGFVWNVVEYRRQQKERQQ